MKKLLFSAAALPSRPVEIAWLLFRLHLGLSIAIGAGWAKLLHITSATSELDKLATNAAIAGPDDWFVQQVADLGFTLPTPYLWATLAIWGEFAGGLLIAFGLLTRLSAFQLAFQFFVIAFLWYKGPEPIVGMYYQQLFFWAFVAMAAIGPGRYSLDYWLTQRQPAGVEPVPTPLPQRQQPKPVAALLALLLFGATVACASTINSDLFIGPGERFVLGGGQRGSFKIEAYNKGAVAVEVSERTSDGKLTGRATLPPRQRATLRFAAGSAAVLVNPSTQKANLAVRIKGEANLGMRSEAATSR